MKQLLVVSGPVASGKTTVSSLVAEVARGHGLVAAAIDMDRVMESLIGLDWRRVKAIHWQRAYRATAGLIDGLFEAGVEIVTLAAPLFYAETRAAVVGPMTAGAEVHFVTLRVEFEEAYRRAQTDPDPGRVITKDRAFLQHLHDSVEWQRLPPDERVIQTDAYSAGEVVAIVVRDVLGLTGQGEET